MRIRTTQASNAEPPSRRENFVQGTISASRRLGVERAGILLLLSFTPACRQDMQDQPKFIPLRPSSFFADGRSARPLVEGTVARGYLRADQPFYTGKNGDEPVDIFPLPVTPAVLARGQERFNIYCSPCHGRIGNGLGMIVRRGLRRPPSFHIDRLRQAPVGYFYDVISNGFGAMPDYAAQIAPGDRWAIVGYVRALQLSQNAKLGDVPEDRRAQLNTAAPPPPPGHENALPVKPLGQPTPAPNTPNRIAR